MNKLNLELAQQIVNFLNELIKIDKGAIAALAVNRVPCNLELANHPTVQVLVQNGYSVGLLGLLNGLCGIHEDGNGPICAIFENHETAKEENRLPNIIGFKLTKE